jgi:hypothetical protein
LIQVRPGRIEKYITRQRLGTKKGVPFGISVRQFFTDHTMEAALLAEADERVAEDRSAINRGIESAFTTVHMAGPPGDHYHRRRVMESAVELIEGLGVEFDAMVFPCCGYAITETLVLERTFPHAQAIFMDRHVDRRVRRRHEDVEATTFLELAGIVRGLEVPTVIVGINSMVSDPKMRTDPGFPTFLEACIGNANVHRKAVLAYIHCWVDDAYDGPYKVHGSALLPLEELSTFESYHTPS